MPSYVPRGETRVLPHDVNVPPLETLTAGRSAAVAHLCRRSGSVVPTDCYRGDRDRVTDQVMP